MCLGHWAPEPMQLFYFGRFSRPCALAHRMPLKSHVLSRLSLLMLHLCCFNGPVIRFRPSLYLTKDIHDLL